MTNQPAPPTRPAAPDLRRAEVLYRRAWWSLALFVPAFVAAFVVGEGLIDLLGYPSGGAETPPVWAMLVAAVPALLVFAAPAAVSLVLARRARDLGKQGAMVPAVVGVGIAGGFVLLNLLSYVVGLIFG